MMPKSRKQDTVNHLRLKAELENLPSFLTFVSPRAQQLGFAEKQLLEIELVLEEILVNIIKYAYSAERTQAGWIDLNLKCKPDDRLHLEIRDRGTPFNPLEQADPDLEAGLMERPIGGLGIYFIKKLADNLSWHRENNENCLNITFAQCHV